MSFAGLWEWIWYPARAVKEAGFTGLADPWRWLPLPTEQKPIPLPAAPIIQRIASATNCSSCYDMRNFLASEILVVLRASFAQSLHVSPACCQPPPDYADRPDYIFRAYPTPGACTAVARCHWARVSEKSQRFSGKIRHDPEFAGGCCVAVVTLSFLSVRTFGGHECVGNPPYDSTQRLHSSRYDCSYSLSR